jgi:carbamoyl-phosphate synthase large subunit
MTNKLGMKKNILVTATGGRSVGSGVLHALTRTSREVKERWNVIAADADSFAWGLYIVEKGILLPTATDPQYLYLLNKTIDDLKIDAVIPGSEAEVNFLSKNIDKVIVPVLCNHYELMPFMMDKFKTVDKLKELNLPYIETFPINQWKAAVKKYDFPFIVKPTVGTGGSKGLHFVFSEEELEIILPVLSEASKYCIQPYIGTGDDEYTVGILSDKEGSIIDSVVMRRKLMGLSLLQSKKHKEVAYAVSTGYSQGFFIKDQRIQSFCETLAINLGSKGPLNIQLRVSGDDIFVFEIHPRFSGTSTMRADIGFNEPDILLRNILYNEKFGRLNYQYNVAAIRAFEHVIVPIEKML